MTFFYFYSAALFVNGDPCPSFGTVAMDKKVVDDESFTEFTASVKEVVVRDLFARMLPYSAMEEGDLMENIKSSPIIISNMYLLSTIEDQ